MSGINKSENDYNKYESCHNTEQFKFKLFKRYLANKILLLLFNHICAFYYMFYAFFNNQVPLFFPEMDKIKFLCQLNSHCSRV